MNDADKARRERIALEFLLLYRSDQEDGKATALEQYLRRFPGDEKLIATEYLALCDAAEPTATAPEAATTSSALIQATQGGDDSDGPRYWTGPRIGSGGMGDVHSGQDRLLDRAIAIKYSRSVAGDGDRRAAILREAVTAARLDHPNIPPVHDLGLDESGRPFLVMRLVRGRPLDAILKTEDASKALQQWLPLFQQICLAIDYAHHRGILHLDLKPANIMIGEFGEMQIVDWGLSSASDADSSGSIRGTPGYMAPEQLLGKPVTVTTDIFALGLILTEICTGERAFDRRDRKRALAARFKKGSGWQRTAPPLQEIITRCLQRDPKQRFTSARTLSQEIGLFLDGVRERERKEQAAIAAVARAEEQAACRRDSLQTAAELEKQLSAHRVESWEPLAAKRPLWKLQDAIAKERATAERALEETTIHLLEAMRQTPDDAGVRDRWARLCWQRFQTAEEAVDRFQQTYFEQQLRALALPEYDELLRGEGRLSLECQPRPQRITLHRLLEQGRRLRPRSPRDLIAQPLAGGAIPHGTWQLTVERAGYRTLSAPVQIHRGEHVRLQWRLRRDHEIGDGFVLVPAGEFTIGGDPGTLQSLPRARRNVKDYCMAQFPVSLREYAEFVRDTCGGSPKRAARRLPRESVNGALHPFIDGATMRIPKRYRFSEHWPVFGVSWHDATAYARWRGAREGRRYRLPSDVEWEKAARGPDARIFPWGNHYDARFCKNLGSAPGRATPARMGKYSADVSPYGVRDMAGGVREWCRSWFSRKDNQRLVRGGGWNQTPIGSRCAYRLPCPPHLVYPFIGFRLMHSDLD